MEQYEYTYPEDEKQPRRKPKLSILIALLIGLCVGGLGGYAIGSESTGLLDMDSSFASPRFILIINAVVVFAVLFLAFLKGSKRQRSGVLPGNYATTSKILILIVLGVLMAGFFAFYMFERLPQ